jgi:hypothetical protein
MSNINQSMPAPTATVTTNSETRTTTINVTAQTIHGPQHASIDLDIDWVSGMLVISLYDFSSDITLSPSFDVHERFLS